MPFLAPLVPLLAGIGSVAGGVGSIVGGSAASKGADAQSALLNQEQQQQAEEFAQMQKVFGNLIPFFQQYMGKGSPILNQVQTGAAENVAHEYGGAEAQTAEKLGASGYGFTPSGTTAGAFGDIEAEKASAGTNTFLQNLLANEATKFKAAQGLEDIGKTLKPGGTGVSQVQPSPLGQGITQIGQGVSSIAKNLPGSSPSSTSGPGPNQAGNTPSDIGFTPPGTLGFPGGDSGSVSA